mmetsp:Transcript_63473/g.124644  ORF Transcript_63473/g.124644 Transcript_63473/m.124644 type:complete len:317 (-) Transcript_63473:112-1062(-)
MIDNFRFMMRLSLSFLVTTLAARCSALIFKHPPPRMQVLAATRSGEHRSMYAVLVDAENAQHSSLELIMEEIATMGADATVRRVYGDFTKPNLAPWKQVSLELSFRPVNAFSYIGGKGSSDAVMIIDAIELLFGDRVDGFALVSSDSDFTPLAQRLREAGKHVIGFGQHKTPPPFVTACERFIYTENLGSSPELLPPLELIHENLIAGTILKPPKFSRPLTKRTLDLLELLNKILADASDDDGWVELSQLGNIVIAVKSDFDVRSYGYRKLVDFFRDQRKDFETCTVTEKKRGKKEKSRTKIMVRRRLVGEDPCDS